MVISGFTIYGIDGSFAPNSSIEHSWQENKENFSLLFDSVAFKQLNKQI